MKNFIQVPRIDISFPESVLDELLAAVRNHRLEAYKLRQKLSREIGHDNVPAEYQERINAMDSAEANINAALLAAWVGKKKATEKK